MAYIQQQTQAASGGDQSEVMSGSYEVQIGDPDSKHHVISAPNDPRETVNQNNRQQIIAQPNHDNNPEQGIVANNHQASSVDSGEEHQDGSDRSSIMHSSLASEGAVGKSPNSYKYPLLKRYFDFGPWVGRNRKALCLGCHLQTSSSQPDRLLKHLNKCTALSDADKLVVADLMNERTANKRKKPMQVKIRRDNDNDSEYYGEDEQNTSMGDDLSGAGQISIPPGGLKKVKRDHTDRKSQIDEALTRFIIMCRVPLKAIHSREFVEFVRALDPEYHIPSRETITNVLIPGLLNI